MKAITAKRRIGEVRLERKMVESSYLLVLNRELCNGCGLCIEVCPKDAISVKPAVTEEGGILHRPVIDIDETKCILCGICAVICPLNALESRVNDEKAAMFVQQEAFPTMKKRINVNRDLCKIDCELKCEEVCPRDAIHVALEQEDGQAIKVIDVHVDEERCVFCKACEYQCPYTSFIVERPFEGSVSIDTPNCLNNCRICVDICPSGALIIKNGVIEVDRNLCICCKACQNVCPESAIHVQIEQVAHTPIQSSTWINLLQRFASARIAAKEMAIKSEEKRRTRIQTLPQMEAEEINTTC